MTKDPYQVMLDEILPDLTERLRSKSKDYGEVFRELGIRGQYSDMHRKMFKLRRALWDGQRLVGEQPDEILADLFGNILITLYLLQEAKGEEEEAHPRYQVPPLASAS